MNFLFLIPEDYLTSPIVPLSIVAVLISTLYIVLAPKQSLLGKEAPPRVHEGWPILGALRFFGSRYDFLKYSRDHSPTGNFSFFLGKHPVIGVTGEAGRKTFFETKGLGFTEGYSVLFAQSPGHKSMQKPEDNPDGFVGPTGFFNRQIVKSVRNENLALGLPKILSDVRAEIEALIRDPSGLTNPFESVYALVYQLTMRTVACDDIADNPELLKKTLSLFQTIDKSVNPYTVLFPWLPQIRRTIAGGQLYMIINKIVNERKTSQKRGRDPLQTLIDQGDDMRTIIQYVIGALFAGLINSAVNGAWILVYLSTNPEWLFKCREEVKGVLKKYNDDPSLPTMDQLAKIPIGAWEKEFPLIDICLRESIRLQTTGTGFRKNISGRAIPTGKGAEVIPPEALVVYAIGDVHYDPSIYPDPFKYDPGRFLPDRAEDKKGVHPFIGWGVGLHPCLGMKFAKLENNVIAAYYITMLDMELVDKNGNPTQELPRVNINAASASKPDKPAYLKYKLRGSI